MKPVFAKGLYAPLHVHVLPEPEPLLPTTNEAHEFSVTCKPKIESTVDKVFELALQVQEASCMEDTSEVETALVIGEPIREEVFEVAEQVQDENFV